MGTLLTTNQAAALLAVGTTSIKRWADLGLLPCVKTPGGHRRFHVEDVEALRGRVAAIEALRVGGDLVAPGRAPLPDQVTCETLPAPELARWLDLLVRNDGPHEVFRAVVAERQRHPSWWHAGDALGEVLSGIGDAWARGELTLVEEHIASERLSRALHRAAEGFTLQPGAPTAFLMTAEGDDHTFGLALLEVGLREAGWGVRWGGSRVPISHALDMLRSEPCLLVGVSASAQSRDARLLADQATRLGRGCEALGIELLFGGRGAWPERPPHGHRLHTLVDAEALVARIARAPR
jgi:excisionase family DNA binding protein